MNLRQSRVEVDEAMPTKNIPYSLDQTLRLLFISSPEFVRRLLIPASRIVGVARLLFESGDYFVQHFWRCGD